MALINLTLQENTLIAMIQFQDFFPKLIKTGGFRSNDEYQDFNFLLAHANSWIAETGVEVLNIETVVSREKDTNKACFLAEEPYCYQYIRVWYNADNIVPEAEAVTHEPLPEHR